MTLRIEDVVPVTKPGIFGDLRGRREMTRGRYQPNRRQFLKGAATVGVGFGLATMSLLPTAKPAKAEHGAWSIRASCNGLDWAMDDNCDGCDLPGSPACCCSGGFFDDTGCLKMHRPNQCPFGTGYDGWKWKTGNCCIFNCNPSPCSCATDREWRCTDGWKRDDCGIDWVATDKRICRHIIDPGTGSCIGGCPE
jgi:TAT (twin-arginine translocation) pathway signal sequence